MAQYRIVEVQNAPRVGGYSPYGGPQWFRNTQRIGTSIIGEYDVNGPADETELPNYAGAWPPEPQAIYRKRVRPGEIIELIGNVGYAKIYRAAYPQGAKPEDDTALYFMERARNPTSGDGLINLGDPVVIDALDHFVTAMYITEADRDRVLQGVES